MKEIYDINIQRMNNGAHFTFVSNILARAEADTAVKGKASELVSNFKAAVAAEDEALKISQKSLLTDEIAKADSDRDALYAGYKKAVEAFLAMPIADMAQAAKSASRSLSALAMSSVKRLFCETFRTSSSVETAVLKLLTWSAALLFTALSDSTRARMLLTNVKCAPLFMRGKLMSFISFIIIGIKFDI